MAKKKNTTEEEIVNELDLLDMEIAKWKGKDYVTKGDEDTIVERVPTGLVEFDYVLGGGVPKGRLLKIYGDPSAGKSCLATLIVKAFQKYDPRAIAYFDSEGTYDFKLAKNHGVLFDKSKWRYSDDDTLEDVFDVIDAYVESGKFSLVVIDTLDSLLMRDIHEGDMGKDERGLSRKKIKQGLNKIKNPAKRNKTTVICIVQSYANPGVTYGNPIISGGGRGLNFASSITMHVKNSSDQNKTLIEDNIEVGKKVNVFIEKNKTWLPHQTAELLLHYKTGFDAEQSLMKLAVKYGIIVKSHAWYEMPIIGKVQGDNTVITHLRQNKEVFDYVYGEVVERMKVEFES